MTVVLYTRNDGFHTVLFLFENVQSGGIFINVQPGRYKDRYYYEGLKLLDKGEGAKSPFESERSANLCNPLC